MIGYYVHHQGLGHLHRAQCIAAHLPRPVTILSSLPRPAAWSGPWVGLPADAASNPLDPTARGRLHWVPLHHPGHRERMGAIADWIRRERPELFVSDVSVEAAALARLMGIPVVVAAMRGDRQDEAHRLGYDLADALLAPWPESLPEPGWPAHWLAKTLHTGSISRYDGRPRPAPHGPGSPPGKEVVVMLGAGGNDLDAGRLREAQRATPEWSWTVLGGPDGCWVEEPWPVLCRARVVVTHAGQNAIAECAAARVPAIVIPQDRPHGEQHATARALHASGLATVVDTWPHPGVWSGLLEEAAGRPDRWAQWSPGDGARRAARLLTRLSTRTSRRDSCALR
ncbi:glycosyl transferase [Streptomyces sp. WAC 01529]|uniref:glycosyltransferase n=1 Tax=Streptomyces sp. WAC 01529 TaxID=2203205 RepID=UPI000F6BEAF4|nr:glycosyltransferase [Streptomyces sp. WAC 01529]AZM56014.1 glycosyl transferase [Streptomyces sp. WAC 01529]